MKLSFFLLIFCCCVTLPKKGQSHPVTFEDGWVISTMNQSSMTLWHMNYSVNNRFALGVDYLRWKLDHPLEIGLVRTNFLVHRWLGKGWQGNFYLLGGLGGGYFGSTLNIHHQNHQNQQSLYNPIIQYDNPLQLAWMGGLQIDYETPTFYTAFIGRMLGNQVRSMFCWARRKPPE